MYLGVPFIIIGVELLSLLVLNFFNFLNVCSVLIIHYLKFGSSHAKVSGTIKEVWEVIYVSLI